MTSGEKENGPIAHSPEIGQPLLLSVPANRRRDNLLNAVINYKTFVKMSRNNERNLESLWTESRVQAVVLDDVADFVMSLNKKTDLRRL